MRSRASLIALTLAGLTALQPGCGGAGSTATTSSVSSTIASADCPVTQANGRTPPGEQPLPNFYGNGKLWTLLPKYTRPDEINRDGALVKKVPWFRGQSVGPEPLKITGQRLDGDAPPLRAHVSGDTVASGRAFEPSLLVFPTDGCWQVTGRAGSASLTFVIRVKTSCKTNRCLGRKLRHAE